MCMYMYISIPILRVYPYYVYIYIHTCRCTAYILKTSQNISRPSTTKSANPHVASTEAIAQLWTWRPQQDHHLKPKAVKKKLNCLTAICWICQSASIDHTHSEKLRRKPYPSAIWLHRQHWCTLSIWVGQKSTPTTSPWHALGALLIPCWGMWNDKTFIGQGTTRINNNWVFSCIGGTPMCGWFVRKNPIEMDD